MALVHSPSAHTQPRSAESGSRPVEARWYITNISRDYRPDLAERVAKANAATGKNVEVHDVPIPDGCVMGSPKYLASWAGDCRSLSIVGGYQDMSDWWAVFDNRRGFQKARTALPDTQPETPSQSPGDRTS